jgi:hypothetical protein
MALFERRADKAAVDRLQSGEVQARSPVLAEESPQKLLHISGRAKSVL